MKVVPAVHFARFRAEGRLLTSFTQRQSHSSASTTRGTIPEFATRSRTPSIDERREEISLLLPTLIGGGFLGEERLSARDGMRSEQIRRTDHRGGTVNWERTTLERTNFTRRMSEPIIGVGRRRTCSYFETSSRKRLAMYASSSFRSL